ncbi:cuticle protein 6-like isoform X2 [Aethina tumida]|uniref:cuticle protein 6-like n=1 Tax=Aethina tumida TaxID=116153 RepID=UPI0021490BC8|nr:cuticle protein 6-like [Aethina tumida]XP_049825759.1 cuticle protein 6-like isoform X1 [Aethina tumida]XP_049825760.1 cuticle protein 6-like isoform X2 [Aethina tumida]
MKAFIALSAILVIAHAFPATNVEVTQDTAGSYNVVVKSPNLNQEEQRDASGSVIGSYSYLDANNQQITVKYVSGPDGFRILEGPVPVAPSAPQAFELVPQQVQDTPEVEAARRAHFDAYREHVALLGQ